MKKTLIFDYTLSGHHLEYIHHLYEYASSKLNEKFIFAIPDSFKNVKGKFKWQEAPNVEFYFLDSDFLNRKMTKNKILYSVILSKLLKKVIVETSSTHVLLIVLMAFIPALPFLFTKNVKITGIIYKIYLYDWKKYSFIEKVFEIFRFVLLTKFKSIEKIFVLNDFSAAVYLNKIWNTEKFHFLVDPFVPINNEKVFDIRDKFEIEKNKNVILHFGGMTERKGTLDILTAIEKLSDDNLKRYCFIFAGEICSDIKNEFYLKYNILKKRAQILVFDEFCEYSFIGSLCKTCDAVLLPYKNTSQSSGVIGYAAQFNKYIISTNNGLLSKIIKKYNMGLLMNNEIPSADAICQVLLTTRTYPVVNGEKYIADRNVIQFTKNLL